MVVVRNKTILVITEREFREYWKGGGGIWVLGDDLGNWVSIRIFGIGGGFENWWNLRE